jgi:hypothetical protein
MCPQPIPCPCPGLNAGPTFTIGVIKYQVCNCFSTVDFTKCQAVVIPVAAIGNEIRIDGVYTPSPAKITATIQAGNFTQNVGYGNAGSWWAIFPGNTGFAKNTQ